MPNAGPRLCGYCNEPIPEARLKTLPHTRYCSAACVEEAAEERESSTHWPSPPKDRSSCPRCGSPTIVRENPKDGSRFIGCTRFPSCFWSGELDGDERDTKRHEKQPDRDRKSVRRFPSPWRFEETAAGYVVKDATGQSVAYVYARETKAEAGIAKVLTMDQARRIAANIAKLPDLLKR
jgi:ssDNA-binding Zn-finger/Zn-ribbon topoisomerase 1